MQLVLCISTLSSSLRSDAVGWSAEDPREYIPNKPIGLTPGPKFWYNYPSVLAAMADGWHLLGLPEKYEFGETMLWDWMLVKEV